MNKLEYLLEINPAFRELKLQEIRNESETIGYHCFAIDNSSFTFSGGTSSSLDKAKRIAIAEAFERSLLSIIAKDELSRKKFLIDDNPSSSGFAAGFNKEATSFRSICEGLECWAWSKWIDEGFFLPMIKEPESLNKLSKHFLKDFDKCYWFYKPFVLFLDGKKLCLNFIVFLGCSGEGIFSGSRVTTSNDELWEHPIIEAYRNYKNFLLYKQTRFELTDIIQQRSIFFAQNKQVALSQIQRAEKSEWPFPEIDLLEEYQTRHKEVFLTRCLMKNFQGWHKGDVTRFVY